MKVYIFNDANGVSYRKINKSQARKVYDSGASIVLCPHNLKPFSPWHPEVLISNTECDKDFNKVVNDFEFYNCTNNETGKYAAYYVDLKNRDTLL